MNSGLDQALNPSSVVTRTQMGLSPTGFKSSSIEHRSCSELIFPRQFCQGAFD
jgi:hypothetical protein